MPNLLHADEQGRIVGQFTIPGNNSIVAGPKLVEFQGQATLAAATFVGEGLLTTESLRVVNTITNTATINRTRMKTDPLAQTFILAQTEQLAAIDLWFEAWDDVARDWVTTIGTSNVLVQLRDVDLGLPTADVLGEALLTPAQIGQQMSDNGFVRFVMPPVSLEADHEYCFVVLCNDAISTLAVAGVGEYDTLTDRYVMAQPYQIGVLLSSSNNRTWTAHQKHDLTFRLLVAHMAIGDLVKVVDLQDVVFADPIDHLLIRAAVDRPNEACNVEFLVTIGEGASLRSYVCAESQPITFDTPYTGTVHLQARLTGTTSSTPTLYRNITVIGGKRLDGSVYISRSLDTNLGLDASVDVSVYYDALLPSGSAVTAWVQDGVVDDEPVFVEMTQPEFGAAADLGDGWWEYRWDYNDLSQPDTRIKLVLTGSAAAIPRVKNLRTAMI